MTRHFIEREYKFPIFDLFDGIVYSAPIKMVKPNKKIYEYILNKYQLVPEECLFVDDTKKNLAAAARFGISTFHFDDNVNELRNFIFSSSNP
jgi:putative hydrolase of the HAD superfamily